MKTGQYNYGHATVDAEGHATICNPDGSVATQSDLDNMLKQAAADRFLFCADKVAEYSKTTKEYVDPLDYDLSKMIEETLDPEAARGRSLRSYHRAEMEIPPSYGSDLRASLNHAYRLNREHGWCWSIGYNGSAAVAFTLGTETISVTARTIELAMIEAILRVRAQMEMA